MLFSIPLSFVNLGLIKRVSSMLPQCIIKYVRVHRIAKQTDPEVRPLVFPDFGVLFILSAALVLFSSV